MNQGVDVYKASWLCQGGNARMIVVTKEIRLEHNEDNEEEELLRVHKRLNREVKVWRMLSHQYIVPLLGFRCRKNPWIILPYYHNGDAFKWLKEQSEVTKTRILTETAEAIVYLHSCNIVHGDIKARNILISDDEHAAVTDFGKSQLLDDLGLADSTATRGFGTLGFLAPECHKSDDYGMKKPRDVYAFGGLIVEIFSKVAPFYHMRHNGLAIQEAIADRHETSPRDKHPKVPDWAWEMAMWCWIADAEQRPEMEKVLEMLTERLAQLQSSN
ncbi:hypothetical protein FRC02_002433 [Tulasnella sp. 418]|nr:hypothetical protein FRC02_002433 [Tulasnella sp. 418]